MSVTFTSAPSADAHVSFEVPSPRSPSPTGIEPDGVFGQSMQLLQGLLSPFETPRAGRAEQGRDREDGGGGGEPSSFNGLAWLAQLGTPVGEAGSDAGTASSDRSGTASSDRSSEGYQTGFDCGFGVSMARPLPAARVGSGQEREGVHEDSGVVEGESGLTNLFGLLSFGGEAQARATDEGKEAGRSKRRSARKKRGRGRTRHWKAPL